MYIGNGCLQKTPLSRDWMRAWTGSVWNMAVITLSRRRRLSISGEMYFNSICGMHFQSRCRFRKLLFLKDWTEKRVGPKIVPCGAPHTPTICKNSNYYSLHATKNQTLYWNRNQFERSRSESTWELLVSDFTSKWNIN